jgi:GTP-binding protein
LAVEVAFAGRSNVGKSSLMNRLMDRKNLVRTSSAPGCTRALQFFEARARDGAVIRLVDLPGYGYARRSKGERASWAELIEGYLGSRDPLRAVVLLVDARRGLGDDERRLVEFLATRPRERRPQTIAVATKIDKLPKSQKKALLQRLRRGAGAVLAVSAVTGEGMAELWQAIRAVTVD